MEQHVVRERPYFWEWKKTEGVMEMDTIKQGRKKKQKKDSAQTKKIDERW